MDGWREGNPNAWKYYCKTIQIWSYHRAEGQGNIDHIKNVALENLIKM